MQLGTNLGTDYGRWTFSAVGPLYAASSSSSVDAGATTTTTGTTGGTNPCAAFCASPTVFTAINYQAGALGAGAVCRETTAAISGLNLSNIAGRTFKVNGVAFVADGSVSSALPAKIGWRLLLPGDGRRHGLRLVRDLVVARVTRGFQGVPEFQDGGAHRFSMAAGKAPCQGDRDARSSSSSPVRRRRSGDLPILGRSFSRRWEASSEFVNINLGSHPGKNTNSRSSTKWAPTATSSARSATLFMRILIKQINRDGLEPEERRGGGPARVPTRQDRSNEESPLWARSGARPSLIAAEMRRVGTPDPSEQLEEREQGFLFTSVEPGGLGVRLSVRRRVPERAFAVARPVQD